jgi:hypothetical protein
MAAPERGAPGSRARHRLSKPFLIVLQLLLAVLVATGALMTTTGSAVAQGETGAMLSQGQLPGVLFRGDSRHPNEVFADGFSSWGTNYDLQAHVHGRGRDSGYISTSGSQSMAESFARREGSYILNDLADQPRCQGPGWAFGQMIPVIGWLVMSHCEHAVVEARTFVYTIDPRFASVVLHVPDQIRGNPGLYNTYRVQDEWAFFRRIPPQAITGVHIYNMDGRAAAGTGLQLQSINFRHERWVANPNYDRNFHSNPVSDPGASLDWDTGLNIPPVQANEYQRGCTVAARCARDGG